jgi:THO complex subunit 2
MSDKSEEYYKNEHTINLAQASATDQERVKMEYAKKTILKRFDSNFQLSLLEQLVRLNSWRDVEIIISLPTSYSNSMMNIDKNESTVDPKWHKGFLQSLIELLSWCLQPLNEEISPGKKNNLSWKREQYDFPVNGWNPEFCIQQVKTTEMLFIELPKIMRVLGSGISSNVLEFSKLLRILTYQLVNWDLNEEQKEMIKLMIQFSFFPALSWIKSNPGITNALWNLIKEFDVCQRYELYDFWFRAGYSLTWETIYNLCSSEKETLDWCKRLNSEKARENGRMLGRISCNNPMITFDLVLSNLRTYSNLIDPTLSALNYWSPLSLDCIAYTVIRHMMDYKKDKIGKTGIISVWLQNIASFTGQFLKKNYHVDLQGIFIYLMNHIKLGLTPEMRLLRDIIMHMSGWMSLDMTEMTENQIECLAGGFFLRIESSEYTEKLRSSKNSEKSLKYALTNKVNYHYEDAEGNTADELYSIAFLYMSLIAKNSKTLLYNTETDQLRFLSSRHDELHLLYIQMSEFLMFAEKPPAYKSLLPSNPLHVLSRTFGLDPEQIFQIVRHSLKPIYELTQEEYETKVNEFKDVIDYHLDQKMLCKNTECSNDYFNEKPYLEEQKSAIWNYISPELYMLFWYLQLSDIYCPEYKYKQSLEKLKARDSTDVIPKKKKQKNDKAKQKSITVLNDEKEGILKSIQDHEKYLQEVSNNLLTKILSKNFQNIRVYLIQYWMFPRLMHTPRDAVYAIKFIELLIKLRTPYFNVIGLIGNLLKEILPCILWCTEKESHNLGIFFLELFKTLKHWQIPSNWEKECNNTPGFDKNIVKESRETISLKEFDKVIKTFNRKILGIVDICLKKDYMAARNAITMLQKLSQVYPTSKDIIVDLEKHMNNVVLNYKEDDLKTLASSYIGILERKLRSQGDKKYPSRPMSVERDDYKSSRKRRDEKYDEKSKSRERLKGKYPGGDSKSPRRERSSTPGKRERSEKSPSNKEEKSSRSKSKEYRKRSKH